MRELSPEEKARLAETFRFLKQQSELARATSPEPTAKPFGSFAEERKEKSP